LIDDTFWVKIPREKGLSAYGFPPKRNFYGAQNSTGFATAAASRKFWKILDQSTKFSIAGRRNSSVTSFMSITALPARWPMLTLSLDVTAH
jgi:hypothetical protein